MKTIVQITVEITHENATDPDDLAQRVGRVAEAAINGVDNDADRLIHDVAMYGTRLLSTKVSP